MSRVFVSTALAAVMFAIGIGGAHGQTAPIPDYYPADYKTIAEGSHGDAGVVIYAERFPFELVNVAGSELRVITPSGLLAGKVHVRFPPKATTVARRQDVA